MPSRTLTLLLCHCDRTRRFDAMLYYLSRSNVYAILLYCKAGLTTPYAFLPGLSSGFLCGFRKLCECSSRNFGQRFCFCALLLEQETVSFLRLQILDGYLKALIREFALRQVMQNCG